MKRSNTCPKCGSNKIAGPHRVYGGKSHVKVDLPGFSTATLNSYTCANCGYTEFYSDRKGLKNIRSSGRFRRKRKPKADKECPVCRTSVPFETTRCPECGYDLERIEF